MKTVEKIRHHKQREPRVEKAKPRKAWAVARAAKRYGGR